MKLTTLHEAFNWKKFGRGVAATTGLGLAALGASKFDDKPAAATPAVQIRQQEEPDNTEIDDQVDDQTSIPLLAVAKQTPQNRYYNSANVAALARIIMSEASTGNMNEKIGVGSTVFNRLKRNNISSVGKVRGAYANDQEPDETCIKLAKDILTGRVKDNTGGATHFYSPRSMDNSKGMNTRGGMEWVPGMPHKTPKPDWANKYKYVPVPGVRPAWYKFYVVPGDDSVA